MANAERDQNFVPTLLATRDTGTAFIPVQATEADHRMRVSDGFAGSNHGPSATLRDSNFVPALLAVSSADGITPVAVYADRTGALLIDSA